MRTRWFAAALTAAFASAVISTGASASGGSSGAHTPAGRGARLSRHAQLFRPITWRRSHRAEGRQDLLPELDLEYNGGGVLTKPGAFVVFWGQDWADGFSTGQFTSAQAQRYITSFLGGLGGSPWLASQTQYCQGVAVGSEFCAADPNAQPITNPAQQLLGTWVDASPIPSSPTDPDVRAEAQRAAAFFGYDPDAVYMVFTPTGHSVDGFGTEFCAYHDSTTLDGQPLAYANLPYMPDAGAACGMDFVNADDDFGHGFFDGYSVVAGHEYVEAVTDPFPSQAYGWLDATGAETADKCAWDMGPGPDPVQNAAFGGELFAVQPLWSNDAEGCVIAG